MPKKKEGKIEVKEKESKKLTQLQFEKKVLELAEKGLTSEKIGEELKNQGVHPQEYNKKISKILGDKYTSPDLKNIESKLAKIEKHYATNKQDKRAMREKDRIFAQLRKTKKYLKMPIK